MAQSMNQLYKQKKRKEDPYTIIEGKKESRDWQCIELGNSVVHFMLEEARERYIYILQYIGVFSSIQNT